MTPMDTHVLEYYQEYSDNSPHGHFHKVIALHKHPEMSWHKVSSMSPTLCRGWFELSHLPVQDRIEFSRDFWIAKLPYHPKLAASLYQFFAALDDVGIFLTQHKYDDVFEPHFVYSLSGNSGFFRGEAAATDKQINELKKAFPDYTLPPDYLAVLQIHNGLAKGEDTGICKSTQMKRNYLAFQELLQKQERPVVSGKTIINPKTLIPFYESFGMPFFQCFWAEWYPDQEMGNVYYSGLNNTISDCTKADDIETMAFETFIDWLLFYLEKID
jgi:hypothetical protein